MDPVIFAVLCGAVSGIAGFAMGGVIFNNVWRFTFSKLAKQVQEVRKWVEQVGVALV